MANVWKTIGAFIGEVAIEAINQANEEAEKKKEELEEQKKFDESVERIMKKKESKNIDRNDLDALRTRVIEIIEEDGGWSVSRKGKELLKQEINLGEDIKDEYYKFIIEYGI